MAAAAVVAAMEEAVARPVVVAVKAVAAKAAATLAVAHAPLTLVSRDKTQAANQGSPSSSVFVTTHSRLCSTHLARLARTASMVSVSAATSTSGNPPVTHHQASHRRGNRLAAIAAGATLAGRALAVVVAANAAPVVAEVARVALVAVAVAVVHTADDKQLAAVVTLQD